MEKKKSYKDYLDKTFLEELNYKVWSTKGSRFNANKRLLKIADLSNLCLSMLSVYLIAIGLLSVYNIYSPETINESLIAYSITCLSILLLVFGQIENAKDFSTKAKQYHNCGLEISSLYNDLRIFKTLNNKPKLNEKRKFAEKISNKYERILERHENHQPIDHNMFKASKAEYHELDKFDVFKIKIDYYIKTGLVYHTLIILPPIVIIGLLIKNI
ncbi:SLATT domain-containing protein [Kordia sp. YSTF-M3]|uniref:SLATT domain-containing protein n=1 Tax=Kordia aestuariivivens TaxID=2759037 RepID=A0ABR7Q5Z3_9FLAO|nr:SLATT domain-containing protein [Kordia aestuariivivens]MBC8753977.1 SLATT domain-containing protein [Kordia aestuariivivens]